MIRRARKAVHDRTGYLLQTPSGTYPALAVNGRMTDKEFRALIDSLVPAEDNVRRGE